MVYMTSLMNQSIGYMLTKVDSERSVGRSNSPAVQHIEQEGGNKTPEYRDVAMG